MFEARGIPFVLLDIVCLVLGGLPLAVFNLGKIRPYQVGFFCSDDSIRYPYHPSTITSTVLYTVGFVLPISAMVIGECLLVYLNRLKSKSSFGSYVARVYKTVGTFVFGAAMSQSLTDIAKYSIGRLRPHFLDVCKPDWTRINCSLGVYIENFTCTGEDKVINEGRLSFYSGTLLLLHVLHAVSGSLPAGSAPGSVGAAPETNPAVLPHCCLRVHGTVAGVRLQTPLERRADRTPAGGADGSAGGLLRLRLVQKASRFT
ncbi:Lipid phosphate phosphohydrolase 1 [Oryzias melastigma]|uniref:Phospholipid phosphatase 1 n=1 Tax=Oryzias melastigma TaxID=30732 RepID=A0A834CLK0_ORYME|nr:Lipid phosphate phosphohydrolase 1 [Oryzias melastigma]